ncbi:hypothetical protein SAMN02910317_02023 [Ruminococcaceae bacterium FB2012]|nr:hypothetical protein SAMN02910317_02023 [Ruminococcaceae bacterium FB2012]
MSKVFELSQKMKKSYEELCELMLKKDKKEMLFWAINIVSAEYAQRCISSVITEEEAEDLLQLENPLYLVADCIMDCSDDHFSFYGDMLREALDTALDKCSLQLLYEADMKEVEKEKSSKEVET